MNSNNQVNGCLHSTNHNFAYLCLERSPRQESQDLLRSILVDSYLCTHPLIKGITIQVAISENFVTLVVGISEVLCCLSGLWAYLSVNHSV